ncbi:MAG TPA: hypothetical protein VJ731_17200 [Terriglobales bacterium]|nr:hypothetical protein [Terriglobales bacterium]
MSTLTTAVQQLKQERDRAQKELKRLDVAIRVLSGLTGGNRGLGRGKAGVGKRRTMSAAARKRIAAAQRARWAKWKAANRKT